MRVAQISDLHLLSLQGAKLKDFASKRWSGAVNLLLGRGRHYLIDAFERLVADLREENIDHVLCTGDVTNLALLGEFAQGRELLAKIGDSSKLTLIPGNHDNYTFDSVKGRYFERTFGEWFPDPDKALSDEAYPFLKSVGDLRVIGLCSAIKTLPFISYGCVGNEQRERLTQMLKHPDLRDHFVVLMVHHHLHDAGHPLEDLRNLRDRRQLLDILKDSPVDLVLHGHEHEPHRWVLLSGKRALTIMSCGTSTRVVKNPAKLGRYNIMHIEDGALLSVTTKKFDPESKRYLPEI